MQEGGSRIRPKSEVVPPKLPISIVPPPRIILPGIIGGPPGIRRLVLGTLTSDPVRAFRPNGFGEMRNALDEISPIAYTRRAATRAFASPELSELQPKIDDYVARSARVVRAIIAETGGNGTDFLNWAKDRARTLATNNEPYSPPTYEDYVVHGELYS